MKLSNFIVRFKTKDGFKGDSPFPVLNIKYGTTTYSHQAALMGNTKNVRYFEVLYEANENMPVIEPLMCEFSILAGCGIDYTEDVSVFYRNADIRLDIKNFEIFRLTTKPIKPWFYNGEEIPQSTELVRIDRNPYEGLDFSYFKTIPTVGIEKN